MVEVGDHAPDFTVPLAGGDAYNDVDAFTLSRALDDGPVVLAFVPAAFTNRCTSELAHFGTRYAAFTAVGAQLYGVSVDLPFAQNVWADQLDLPFPLLSDPTHEVIAAYGVEREGFYDVLTVAERSVFVIDREGTVTYKWVEDPAAEPDWDSLVEDVCEVAVNRPP